MTVYTFLSNYFAVAGIHILEFLYVT